ncbi:D-amino-acid transaminase [Bacillaceae bacterium SIJ1]|uniref:D-amino-acid transaminase n=1 Tax=Litoribacterium kuwaitense TaxID=1398745 RepID=UPI0013E9A37E|nr:D-amino-acid transaminase [Litoribacterium kuwaitense]NGP44266.1 D-amino-acid transaminase [Litoribacterium kuwaitense]
MRDKFIYRNGVVTEDGKVDLEERGFQFGDGIYEVIEVREGKLLFFAQHFARLKRSCAAIQIEHGLQEETFKAQLKELLTKNSCDDGMVYIQLTRGTYPRDHAFPQPSGAPGVYAYTVQKDFANMWSLPATAVLADDIRWLRCDIKSLNLLGSVLAKQKAAEAGADEAILHREGIVTEGSSTNVFIVKNGYLQTHPASHLILSGVTRSLVLKIAADEGIPVLEKAFTTEELFSADEVFFTATTQRIRPILSIDGTTISTEPGPVTEVLQKGMQTLLQKELQER